MIRYHLYSHATDFLKLYSKTKHSHNWHACTLTCYIIFNFCIMQTLYFFIRNPLNLGMLWHTFKYQSIIFGCYSLVYLSIQEVIYQSCNGNFLLDNAAGHKVISNSNVQEQRGWVQCTSVESPFIQSESSRTPLGCTRMGGSQHEATADKICSNYVM